MSCRRLVQNFSSDSLEVLRNWTLPTRGSSTGAVITSLPRGYWNTAPPSDFLLDGLVVEAELLRGERSGETRGPGADDQHVEGAGALSAGLGDRLERLLTLQSARS